MTDTYDTEERQEKIASKQKEREDRSVADIQFVMGSEQGRRVIWHQLEMGGVFSPCFNIDSHVTAFNEGQRNLALALFQRVVTHCPDLYLKMAAEAAEDRKEAESD